MTVHGLARQGVARLALICGGALLLAGCVETLPAVEAAAPRDQIQRRADVSPRGAPVAFASIEGGSPALVARFAEALKAEAGSREIAIVAPKDARYVVRGYLDAEPQEKGVSIVWVWDVFDARHARIRRMSDALTVSGDGADPWGSVDADALQSIASRSTDDLAAFLSNTSEAIVAARTAPAKVAAQAASPVDVDAVAEAP